MKSPFPGMDPYLEAHWRDVHHSFLTYARDALQEYLPSDLRARLEERVFVEPDFDDARSIYPGCAVPGCTPGCCDGEGRGDRVAAQARGTLA